MKTTISFLTFLMVVSGYCVLAQSTEEDDMYFTSKDRQSLNALHEKERVEVLTSSNARRITESETASVINPTDSYSARNVNPEYVAGNKVGSTTAAPLAYFTPTYQPTAVNLNLARVTSSATSYNQFNNSNSFYNPYSFGQPNPGMGMGMGMAMSPWGYNNFGMMPWMMYGMNGFYQSGLSIGMSMGSGFGWGNGFNNFYNPWGYNSWAMNSFYGGYNGWGTNSFYGFYNPYSYRYGFNGGTQAFVDNVPRATSSRNQEVDRYYNTDGTRGRNDIGNAGGRVTSTGDQQYYNRTWRNDAQQVTRGTDSWNNTRSYQQNYNNSWNNNSRTNSNWGSSDFGSGRSSSFSNGGGGSNGGGAVSGGGAGGGGGARRGRD